MELRETSKSSKGDLVKCIAALVISFTILAIANLFHWIFVELFFPLGLFPLHLWIAGAPFVICAVWSLIQVRHVRKHGIVWLVPAALSFAAYVFLATVPFTEWWLDLNFWRHRAEREKVVTLVAQDELKPNVAHSRQLIALDSTFGRVSAGGNDIIVRRKDGRTYVLFFTFRGILSRYSGFLNIPPDGSVEEYRELGGDRGREKVRITDRWYFVSH